MKRILVKIKEETMDAIQEEESSKPWKIPPNIKPSFREIPDIMKYEDSEVSLPSNLNTI
ncbi:MAG: hypothetical protein LBU88_07790 [Treponema sp.]|jgi:hypothetical protein|nr:hypothetical protein [Treponema sp.]